MAAIPVRSQKTAHSDVDIRQLLVRMKQNHRSTEQLAILFQVGDNKIAELIGALSDPDKEISFNAQIVIRYLGNEQAMNAWRKMYEADQQVSLTGPIPIPLSGLDFSFVREQYLNDRVKTEALMDAYLFALALDGSPQAARLLSDVIGNANKHGFKLHELRYTRPLAVRIGDDGDLAKAVLRQATFLDPADRMYTTAKLIAKTAANDKALVEIHVNRGALAQEWYHVVVNRCEQGWRFFSITEVAIS